MSLAIDVMYGVQAKFLLVMDSKSDDERLTVRVVLVVSTQRAGDVSNPAGEASAGSLAIYKTDKSLGRSMRAKENVLI